MLSLVLLTVNQLAESLIVKEKVNALGDPDLVSDSATRFLLEL